MPPPAAEQVPSERPFVRELVARMTLAEKIGQMTQVDHGALEDEADVARYFLGSVLSGGGSDPAAGNSLHAWRDLIDRLQAHATSTPLAIPLLYGLDAVHGNNNVLGAVIFPHNIGLGAAGSEDLVARIGAVTALEMRAIGANWNFAPCVCVPRDLRWGRTYEGFSSDPDLVARLGAAAVRGLQSGGLANARAVAATAKHFVADGGTRPGTGVNGGLDQGDARLPPDALRAIHAQPYVAAIDAGVAAVMASFSSWNGIKVHGDRHLLTDLLRGELGFEGVLLSDWGAVQQLHPDFKNAIGIAINAGIDMVMVPDRYREFIRLLTELVEEGRVPIARIDESVERVLALKESMGLLAPGYDPRADRTLEALVGSSAHRELARRAVRESLVLLKNDGRVLPLSPTAGRIHVTGRFADDLGAQAGGWTIEWQGRLGAVTTGGTTIFEAFRQAMWPVTDVTFSYDGSGAAGADAAVVVIGEEPYAEFEGDRADLTIHPSDRAAVLRAARAGVPVVLVILSGRPLVLGDVVEHADAIAAAWLPGTEGGGIVDVLLGVQAPSGRLPYHWPRSMEQLPGGRGEGTDPLWPRGHGLTY